MSAADNHIDKALFIRSDGIGEFLLSLPAVKLFRMNHPETKIYLMANKENIDLIKNIDFIDYFVDYGEYYQGFRGTRKLERFLKEEQIDCVIALNPKKYFHCAAWLAHVSKRVGYSRKMGFLLNKAIKDKKYLELKHEVEYNIDLIRPFCPDGATPAVDIPVAKIEELDFLKLDLGKRYVFIHPFALHPHKEVDVIFWLELIGLTKAGLNKELILIGSAQDKDAAKFYQEKGGMHNVVGKLRLPQLAAFLKNNCSLFVGIDSGPMHLSAFLNCPTIGLFKTANPDRWGPWGKDVLAIRAKTDEEFRLKIPAIFDFARKHL